MNEHRDSSIFRGMNPAEAVITYRRNLPHWRQKGVTYFVTFRLADSIPFHIIEGWKEDDRMWMKANGILGPLSNPKWRRIYEAIPLPARRNFELRASRRMHVELDRSQGSCILGHREVREPLVEALFYFHSKRWLVGDVVIMPNHVHALLKPLSEYKLELVLGSVKGFVSSELTKCHIKSDRMWQSENYDRIVRDRRELHRFRKYIERNPMKSKLSSDKYFYHRCDWLDAKDETSI